MGDTANASWIRTFFPGYFALVMATGIVSMAWQLQGYSQIARPLFWLNVPIYLILWIITVLRLVKFPAALFQDLTSHARGATFLTLVAGTCVLGKQIVSLTPFIAIGKGFWFLALFLWVILLYTFFAAITVTEPKPKLEAAINGGWLLVVVSTESLCTLGTIVAPQFSRPEIIAFISLAAYMLGAMFYIVLITLILYRWIFRSMDCNALTPPYWINMGALAITTLAGARLLVLSETLPFLTPFKPFILGFTLFFWSTATWWIPLLILVGAWRHLWGKQPIVYDPQYWSLVFPLGMYSVATFLFAEVANLPFLVPLSFAFAVAALLAWTVTFVGLLRHLLRSRTAQT